MATLKKLLQDYMDNGDAEMLIEHTIKFKPLAGDVVEFPTNKNPILACIIDNEEPYEAILMSYLWEMATTNDLIIHFDHTLRDTWILQSDIIIYLTESMLISAKRVGKINKCDLEIIRNYMENDLFNLPEEKTGTGTLSPIKQKFKLFEAKRVQGIFRKFIKEISEMEKTLLYLSNEALAALPAVAERKKDAVATDKFIIFNKGNKLKIKIIDKSLIGKSAYIDILNSRIFVNKLPEEFFIELQSPINNISYIARRIKIEEDK